jgi:hypothetical protein
MRYVGVDLTSAFSAVPRAIDVAVLDEQLNCTFALAKWPASALVTARDFGALFGMLTGATGPGPHNEIVWAIDGPQGLANRGQSMRVCERSLGTPGRTPDSLPPTNSTRPFGGYIRSSIDLFGALHGHLQLAGFGPMGTATLFEVFPGAEWVVLAGRLLPKKTSASGRAARRQLLQALGIVGVPPQVTADQNDALVAAYLAWCARNRPTAVTLEGQGPSLAQGELLEGFILHSTASSHVAATLFGASTSGQLSTPPTGGGQVAVDDDIENDWSGTNEQRIRLNDTGLVHGNDAENAWLLNTTARAFETVAPHPPVSFTLMDSNQRGSLRVDPTIPKLLAALGIDSAGLSKRLPITLPVRTV